MNLYFKGWCFMKALILYTNTGAGHVSAGKSICDALKKFNVDTVEYRYFSICR